MKKIFALAVAVLLAVAILNTAAEAKDGRLSIVTTIFPQYDWVRNIVGSVDTADVTLLQDSGVDLHSFQATADDMIRISNCDLFICVGGESDSWTRDALAGATNKNMKVISLLDALGDSVKEEKHVEGMEAEKDDGEGAEADEHVWLSLRNAETLVRAIADALAELDTGHAETYRTNADAYAARLCELDARYRAVAENAARRTLLFGDRFPFRYLADDLGLEYYAAFAGCSAETEASFETVAFLADKVRELGLPVVLTIDGGTGRVAETVAETSGTGAKILSMDSMQSVTARDIAGGASYLAIMEHDLDVLKAALN